MYLLDTNVVSELRKVKPGRANSNVAEWSAGVAAAELYISAITIYELERGVLRMERSDANQGKLLRAWLNGNVMDAFAGRILPVDEQVARQCAALDVPDPRPFHDALIAATAMIHGLVVVTRNTADFAPMGVGLLNPWATSQ